MRVALPEGVFGLQTEASCRETFTIICQNEKILSVNALSIIRVQGISIHLELCRHGKQYLEENEHPSRAEDLPDFGYSPLLNASVCLWSTIAPGRILPIGRSSIRSPR
jgi:hypothetical protein